MYNVNIMKNGRKKKNSKSYSIYFYFMSGADLGFVWHEELVVGRGGRIFSRRDLGKWDFQCPEPRTN